MNNLKLPEKLMTLIQMVVGRLVEHNLTSYTSSH